MSRQKETAKKRAGSDQQGSFSSLLPYFFYDKIITYINWNGLGCIAPEGLTFPSRNQGRTHRPLQDFDVSAHTFSNPQNKALHR